MSASPERTATEQEVYRQRRERVLAAAGAGVVVVPAAPQARRWRHAELPYRAGSDLYYLTGLEEPGAAAVLTPHDPAHRFTLFVQPRDPERESWNGPRLGVQGAAALGADAVYPIEEFDQRAAALVRDGDRMIAPLGADDVADTRLLELFTRARSGRARSGAGPVALSDLDAILGPMRRVKDALELDRIRTAAEISAAGHRAAMRAARPGAGEWEVEAALEAEFRRRGAAGPAFASIVGAGANATVLHYTANSSRIGESDLLLVDAGAEWSMYCADITRTLPASGRFTPIQRELYRLVLDAEQAAIAAVRPGTPVTAPHDAAVAVLAEGMVRLRILPDRSVEQLIESGEFRRYYLHQTSHWIGLEVHDVGAYREGGEPAALEPGMVLTVEPGLYLPADDESLPPALRGIGIRIEDTVAVHGTGCEILTRDVPVDPDAIEAIMRGA